jgi:hypothetical protein
MSAAVVIGDSFHLMNMPVVLTAQQRIAWGTRRIAVSTHYVAANSAVNITSTWSHQQFQQLLVPLCHASIVTHSSLRRVQ